jgi:hypothetical protein
MTLTIHETGKDETMFSMNWRRFGYTTIIMVAVCLFINDLFNKTKERNMKELMIKWLLSKDNAKAIVEAIIREHLPLYHIHRNLQAQKGGTNENPA